MDRTEVLREVSIIRSQNMTMRYGQTVFNFVSAWFPEVVEDFIGKDVDCYYDDSKVDAFLSACGIY